MAGPIRGIALGLEDLGAGLGALERTFGRGFLHTDPLGIVRRFEPPEDRELVGWLAAGLAYGRVATIRASLESVLSVLGPRPSRFLESYDPRRDGRRFEPFRHRFTSGRDVALALSLLRQSRERWGSLEALFLRGDPAPEGPDLALAMSAFGEALFSLDGRPFVPDGRVPRTDPVRRLLPLPSAGSVCKRHCLFLRWMVRPDDGVDCGVWSGVSRSRLLVPLDTHTKRIARALGWTRRRTASWGMVLDVTQRLRLLDPADPTRYDFALSRLGILGHLRASGGRVSARDVEAVLREVL